MERDSIKEELHFIFNNVNEWLKFAEAKNAVLISLIGASLIGMVSYWSSLNPEHQVTFKCIFFPCEIIALLISFYSFLPDLKIFTRTNKKKSKKTREGGINLYYFGHLKDLTKEHLLKEIYNKDLPEKFSRIELDLAYQITINSDIAWRKFNSFKIAGYIALVGILTPSIILMVLLFIN